MINRRIIISSLSVITALSLMTGATFAFFTDTASSQGNSFTSGNADLQLAQDVTGNAGTFGNNISGPVLTNLYPGFTGDFPFWVKNNSSANIPLAIKADLSGTQTGELADNLYIRWTCDTDGNGSLVGETPTAEFTVNQWISGGDTTLIMLNQNVQRFCQMHARIPNTAGDDIQGDSAVFNADYNATQQ
jgi:predicted ribosomally synthesized peptide with SipW-like signal peptide